MRATVLRDGIPVFVDFSSAFDYCRELNHPVKAVVQSEFWKLYPSGKAERVLDGPGQTTHDALAAYEDQIDLIIDLVIDEVEIEECYGPTGVSHLGTDEMRSECRIANEEEALHVKLDIPDGTFIIPVLIKGQKDGIDFLARHQSSLWLGNQIELTYSIELQ